MLEKMEERSGNVLDYPAIGKITKQGYTTLNADVKSLLPQAGSLCLLLDRATFRSEESKTWGADLNFGRDFRKQTDKMVIVGDKKWQERIRRSWARSTRSQVLPHRCEGNSPGMVARIVRRLPLTLAATLDCIDDN